MVCRGHSLIPAENQHEKRDPNRLLKEDNKTNKENKKTGHLVGVRDPKITCWMAIHLLTAPVRADFICWVKTITSPDKISD